MDLRCYQRAAVDGILARYASGDQRTLVVLPTGSGKTVVAGHVAKHFVQSGRVMVLAHRDELIRQAAEKFAAITGIMPDIEKADERSFEESIHGPPRIVVSSVQTQMSGSGAKKRMHRFYPGDFALLWIDEAHHSVAGGWKSVIDHYASNPNCKVLGVTATADRADGEALGQVFQSVAFHYELPDIIEDGYLVPIRQRSVVIDGLDFSKVRTTAGDLNAGDLEAVMMFEKPLHGVAHAAIELAYGLKIGTLAPIRDAEDRADRLRELLGAEPKRRRTLVFAVSVAHAERLAEIFNRWLPGSAAHIDGGMSRERRKQVLRAFRRGETQFLVNCMIATEGFDEPAVEIVVMARPTKSRPLYAQMAGRGTRPAEAIAAMLGTLEQSLHRRDLIANSIKPFMDILDFAGNSGRHKLVSATDLLGCAYAPEAVEMAREMSKAESIDVSEALNLAKDELDRRKREAEQAKKKREEEAERKRQAEAAKRAALVGTTDYHTRDVDGFDRFGVRVDRENGESRPSDKQVKLLIAFGVEPQTARGYTMRQAGKVITTYKRKGDKPVWSRLRESNRPKPTPIPALFAGNVLPATSWYRQKLMKLDPHVRVPATADEAKRMIEQLERRGAA